MRAVSSGDRYMGEEEKENSSSCMELVRASDAAVTDLFVAMDDSSVLSWDSRDVSCSWKLVPSVYREEQEYGSTQRFA